MAQQIDDNPVAYMNAMSNAHLDMDKKYMQYTSAAAHGKRARKVEKLRLQVLEAIQKTREQIIDLPYFKGNKTFRQSNLNYVDFCYKIFNEDYSKIVNMEDIAEQSFDEMQAYILIQEKIDEKLKAANDSLSKAEEDFAKLFNVSLIEGEKSKLGKKLAKAALVSKYYHPISLIFFKTNWQYNKMIIALNNKKVNDAEQARLSTIQFAEQGSKDIESIKDFEGDLSVKIACKMVLEKYKAIATTEAPTQIEFFLKSENFEKIKKNFESKSQSEKSKEDVESYNKAVNEFNQLVNKYNLASANSKKQQNEILKNWDDAVSSFFDTYTPKY